MIIKLPIIYLLYYNLFQVNIGPLCVKELVRGLVELGRKSITSMEQIESYRRSPTIIVTIIVYIHINSKINLPWVFIKSVLLGGVTDRR